LLNNIIDWIIAMLKLHGKVTAFFSHAQTCLYVMQHKSTYLPKKVRTILL